MGWVKVRTPRTQPSTGIYSQWKEEIAEDCFRLCVYCKINENDFGGLRNFHVDHYKPKSKFGHLEQIADNLFLCCSICNCFKSDYWDDLGTFNIPDPSVGDYGNNISENSSCQLDSQGIPYAFMIHKLYLNRVQLILYRRERKISKRMDEIRLKIKDKIQNNDDHKSHEILKHLLNIEDTKNALSKIPIYKLKEIQRKK